MARSYANVACAIWRDDEFRVLSQAAQHVYLLLISQPDISAAGVLSLSLTRWASRTKDTTRSAIRAAIEELETHRFVAVDDETEELLVRSFIRWDGGYTNSKRRFAIRDAAAHVESVTLRRALAAEFERLDLPPEWIPAFSQVDSLSIAHTENADGPSQFSSDQTVVGTKGEYLEPQPTTSNPQPTTHTPSTQAPKRGTRLPEDFTVTEAMKTWARKDAPLAGLVDHEMFVDHWRAQTGQRAVKRDWEATWRNWMRRVQENRVGRPPGSPPKSTTDDRMAQAIDLGRRLQAERDGQNGPKELGA